MNLWQVDIRPADGQPDSLGVAAESAGRELGISDRLEVHGIHGFLLQGSLDAANVSRMAREYLADPIAQRVETGLVGSSAFASEPAGESRTGGPFQCVHVLLKPGVMDPVAQSTLGMLKGLGFSVEEVRTFRKYWICGQAAGEKRRTVAAPRYAGPERRSPH